MLLTFADDDLYRALQAYQDTYNKKDKVPPAETDEWWASLAPAHLARLEALVRRPPAHLAHLMAAPDGDRFTSGGFTAGELVLFAVLHQMTLVRPGLLRAAGEFPGVAAFYARVAADERVARVLRDGGGFAAPLRQYFVPGREAKEPDEGGSAVGSEL